jgi:hypothetical protein
MKKVLILSSLLLLGVTSCKKVYQCTCTTTGTSVGNGGSTTTSGTTNTFTQKVTLSDAQSACPAESIVHTTENGYDIFNTTTCELLK